MSFILEENKNQNPDDIKKEWDVSKGMDVLDEDDSDTGNPYEDNNDKKQMRKSNVRSFVFDLLFYAILIFVCIYILPNFVIQRTIVDGSSMADTLLNGEQLYVEKISYHFDMLDRFDIIVFYPYGRENEEYYVKRIIGLPGETIQIIGSDIYINNEKLEETYGKDPIEDQGRAAQPITLGEDEYFVMGDNRNVSKDSRDEEVGNVSKENIGGKAIFRISPFSRFGTID
jgi:signal peptidase I